MSTSNHGWYVPISEFECLKIGREENDPANYRNTVFIIDASQSMRRHFDMLLEVGKTSLNAGCFTIFFSTGSKIYTPQSENNNWIDDLKNSNAWDNMTHYNSALNAAAECVNTGCSIMFFTDGAPNGGEYGGILSKMKENVREMKGFMQAIYLGSDPGPVQLKILCDLCSEGREPRLVNNSNLEAQLRGFLANTISISTDPNSGTVSVGEYRVTRCKRSELNPESIHNLLEHGNSDVPFVCGSVAALLYFMQQKRMNASTVYKTVSSLNKWMSGVSQRDRQRCYQVENLIRMGHELAGSTLRESQSTATLVDILNAGKVISFAHPVLVDQMDVLVNVAMQCMANNPSKLVKRAFVARSKLQAKTQFLAEETKRIIDKNGPEIISLINGGGCKCVSMHVDEVLLTEIKALANGSTSQVEHANIAIANPSMINVSLGSVWYPTSFTEQQQQPSLILTPCPMSSDLLKLATANLIGIHTGMSPLMVINAIWNMPLDDSASWLLADEVINQLRTYCDRGKNTNPFKTWPHERAYPYGFGFTDEAKYVQMPSPKSAVLAPLLQAPPLSSMTIDDSRELWIRCMLPIVHSIRDESWPATSSHVSRMMTIHFNCQPEQIISDIIAGNILDQQQYIKLATVPCSYIALKSVREEMRTVLDRRLGILSTPLPGIACPLPTDRMSLEHMFRYVTRDRNGTNISQMYCFIAEAASRIASVSGFTASHPELDALFTGTQMQGLPTGFSFIPMKGMFRERVQQYGQRAALPKNLDHLFKVYVALDIPFAEPEHLLEHIPFTGQQANALLTRFPGKEEFIMCSTSLCTVTREIISNWQIGWCKHMLRQLRGTETMKSMDLDAVAACLEKFVSESVLASQFICDAPPDIMSKLFRKMRTRVAFATPALSSYLQRFDFTEEELLNQLICVPGYCLVAESSYLKVLQDGTKYEMAQALLSHGSCGQVLLENIYQLYSELPITAAVRQVVTQWILSIGNPVTEEKAWNHFTRLGKHSLVSGHGWIRKQLQTVTNDGEETYSKKLIYLAQLRSKVLRDHKKIVGTTGKMKLHNNALEVMCHCLATHETKVLPERYKPIPEH